MTIHFGTQRFVVLLIAAGLIGCAGSPQARRDKALSRAKEFLVKKDYRRALLEFKNAAKAMPNDAETYYQMGLGYLAARDGNMAYAAFNKAIALNPKHVNAELKLAQILSTSNDPGVLKDAEGRLKRLVDSEGATSDMLNALALTELKLGNSQQAIATFQEALEQSPGELSSAVMLAKAKLAQKDVQGAEAVLRKACAESPKSAEARRFFAEFYLSQGKTAEAEAVLHEALSLDPRNGAALLDLGRLQSVQGRNSEAERTFKTLSSVDGYFSSYAIYLFDNGRSGEAIKEFERLAKENPDDRQMRTNLVIAYRKSNRSADAGKILQQALKKNGKDADARLEWAEIEIEKGQYPQAEIDLNQVLKLRPTAPEAHYVMARLNLLRGMSLTYRQELAAALNLNPELLAIRVEFAQNFIDTKQYAAARDLLDAAPGYQRSSLPVIVARNWALWGLGSLSEMRKGIDEGLQIGRTSDLLVQDGLLKLSSGNPAPARISLEQALNINPNDIRALSVMRQTYIAQKNPAMAVQKTKEYAAAHPNSAEVQDFLGLILLGAGDREHARVALEAAKAANPKFIAPDLTLVQMDLMQGKAEDAEKRLQSVLSLDAGNNTARTWLGGIEALRGERDLAIANLQRVAAADPRNPEAQNNLAYLLIDKDPVQALKYAQKAVELAPDRPAYCDTLGWTLYQKGMYSAAVPYLERAATVKQDPVWAYHLAMAYAKSGDLDRGRRTFEAALKQNPNLPEAEVARGVMGH